MIAQRIFAHLMVLILAAGCFAMVYALSDLMTVGKYLMIVGLWIMGGASLLIPKPRKP